MTYNALWKACCILLVLSSMSACNDKDLVSEPDVQLSQREISITTSLEASDYATRAFVHDATNIITDRLRLYTYFGGSNTEYFRSDALYENGTWIFFGDNIKGRQYYWPMYGKLHFFAHFPNELASHNMTFNGDIQTPQFTYSGTAPATDVSQKDLKETIFAYHKDCTPSDNGQFNLVFHRPFSQVVCKLDQAIRCTIKSVKITGVKNSGTVTCAPTKPYATWQTSGNDTYFEVDFSAKDEYSTNGGIRYPEDINSDTELAQPFIAVPQTLTEGAYIEVTYKALGADKFTTVKSALNKAISGGNAVTEWKLGNKYIYSLTLNGAANEIFVAVKVSDWIVEGETVKEVN